MKQTKTLKKYLLYLLELIFKHHLIRLSEVNIIDYIIAHNYFEGNITNLRRALHYMIDYLVELGILECICRDYSHFKHRARLYRINIEKFVEACKLCGISTEALYAGYTERKVNSFYDNKQVAIDAEGEQYLLNKYGCVINKFNVKDMNKIKFSTKLGGKVYTVEELVELGTVLMCQAKENAAYVDCLSIIDRVNHYHNDMLAFSEMPMHLKVSGRKRISMSIGTRHYCSYAIMKKGERKGKLLELGLDAEFDLHSAIFAVARLLNTGVFDVNWDIKRLVVKNYDQLDDDTKEYIKNLFQRSFFSNSPEQIIANMIYVNKELDKYNADPNHTNKRTKLVIPTLEEMTTIFDGVFYYTQGTKFYWGNIFIYESLFELLIYEELLKRGYHVRNVYDCFYYNSKELSEKELKVIITEIANNFNNYVESLYKS